MGQKHARVSYLQPYLKRQYRYYQPGMALLDKLYGLSFLLDLVKEQPDPVLSLESLKKQIVNVIQMELKKPLTEVIELLGEGLQLFEQLQLKPDLRPSGDSADDAIFWRLKRARIR